jgi:hypothetical protein
MAPTRQDIRELADQLVVEYSGALPPGQVMALVHRTAHRLSHSPVWRGDHAAEMCEDLVRRVLAERLGLLTSAAQVA